MTLHSDTHHQCSNCEQDCTPRYAKHLDDEGLMHGLVAGWFCPYCGQYEQLDESEGNEEPE